MFMRDICLYGIIIKSGRDKSEIVLCLSLDERGLVTMWFCNHIDSKFIRTRTKLGYIEIETTSRSIQCLKE
ncbi:hypothetical protein BLOT_014563 [Blomia tropicalis]|nr:hypothetical protein BLOT_014563 [Blomia tropicalis]